MEAKLEERRPGRNLELIAAQARVEFGTEDGITIADQMAAALSAIGRVLVNGAAIGAGLGDLPFYLQNLDEVLLEFRKGSGKFHRIVLTAEDGRYKYRLYVRPAAGRTDIIAHGSTRLFTLPINMYRIQKEKAKADVFYYDCDDGEETGWQPLEKFLTDIGILKHA